jgi:CDP-diglyceride synthetase
MKTIATNSLFILYAILVIAAIVPYVVWLKSLDQVDKTLELVMLILIGIVFLLSLYLYYACDTFTFPGIIIFTAFTVVMTYTFLTSRQEDNKIYRRLTFIFGLLSLVTYINESNSLPEVNLE